LKSFPRLQAKPRLLRFSADRVLLRVSATGLLVEVRGARLHCLGLSDEAPTPQPTPMPRWPHRLLSALASWVLSHTELLALDGALSIKPPEGGAAFRLSAARLCLAHSDADVWWDAEEDFDQDTAGCAIPAVVVEVAGASLRFGDLQLVRVSELAIRLAARPSCLKRDAMCEEWAALSDAARECAPAGATEARLQAVARLASVAHRTLDICTERVELCSSPDLPLAPLLASLAAMCHSGGGGGGGCGGGGGGGVALSLTCAILCVAMPGGDGVEAARLDTTALRLTFCAGNNDRVPHLSADSAARPDWLCAMQAGALSVAPDGRAGSQPLLAVAGGEPGPALRCALGACGVRLAAAAECGGQLALSGCETDVRLARLRAACHRMSAELAPAPPPGTPPPRLSFALRLARGASMAHAGAGGGAALSAGGGSLVLAAYERARLMLLLERVELRLHASAPAPPAATEQRLALEIGPVSGEGGAGGAALHFTALEVHTAAETHGRLRALLGLYISGGGGGGGGEEPAAAGEAVDDAAGSDSADAADEEGWDAEEEEEEDWTLVPEAAAPPPLPPPPPPPPGPLAWRWSVEAEAAAWTLHGGGASLALRLRRLLLRSSAFDAGILPGALLRRLALQLAGLALEDGARGAHWPRVLEAAAEAEAAAAPALSLELLRVRAAGGGQGEALRLAAAAAPLRLRLDQSVLFFLTVRGSMRKEWMKLTFFSLRHFSPPSPQPRRPRAPRARRSRRRLPLSSNGWLWSRRCSSSTTTPGSALERRPPSYAAAPPPPAPPPRSTWCPSAACACACRRCASPLCADGPK